MKEYVPIIVSVIAGVFAVGSAVFAWKLKQSSDNRIRELTKKEQAYNEIKNLYIKIHEMFEELIKNTIDYRGNYLNSDFSKLTAEVKMLASNETNKRYHKVTVLYQEWVKLYIQAYPPSRDGYYIIQTPDPALKYKQPENEAREGFTKEYERLVEFMRAELENFT